MKYKWLIKEDYNFSKDFLNEAGDSEVIAKLLVNRGIDTVEKAKSYLNPEFYQPSKPEEIGDLLKAKNRILEAIDKKEKIVIFGDYDVDGVTSTSCLLITLRQFTNELDFYIPSRLTEGYGLNLEAVKTIAQKLKAKLLITCDCGITNVKEVELANELGMDVIVTDHHSLPEILPPAYAVLNPKFLPEGHKLHFLPGVGVAYKLAEAILEERKCSITSEDLLDLVTLGMIADLAPLVDENRYLVQIGLSKLANTDKIGLRELLKVCGLSSTTQTKNSSGINSEHIGFGIAPRINAVGRLTDANLAVKLMTTVDLLEATQLATELEFQNRERQVLCDETLKDVVALASEQVNFKEDKCIILAKEGWHHGVIGIVASRILEKYSLPTLLICIDEEQNIARGSGRSIGQLNIVDALASCSSHLEKFGGHKAACGLSVKPENIPSFISNFKKTVNNLLKDCNMEPTLNVDSELSLSKLNLELISKINKLSPFGFGNKMPIFKSDEAEIVGIRSMGKNGQHLKLYIKCENGSDYKTFEALIWNHDFKIEFEVGDKVNLAYTPKVNTFGNETSIQLEVKDFDLVRMPAFLNNETFALYDFRGKTDECTAELSLRNSVLFFAEYSQKEFHPLKTFSRASVLKKENIAFLDLPPDEETFVKVVKQSNAKNIYLSFISSELAILNPEALLSRLIGMLRYVVNNKDSKITEIQLQSALSINKNTLAYSLKILEKIEFLNYSNNDGELSINISKPARQNYQELIEYNLLVSEIRKIQEFHRWIFESEISEIELKLNQLLRPEKTLLKEPVRVN